MIKLNNVTLVCIDSKYIEESINAIKKSINSIDFKDVIFLTHEDIILNFAEVKKIDCIDSIRKYDAFCLTKLNDYINTEYCLILQHDGYIINPQNWRDNFLKFDYIGALWPNYSYIKNRVGNGGFSLRSKKFLESCQYLFKNYPDIDLRSEIDFKYNEDFIACNSYYEDMLDLKNNFADIETASWFSVESPVPEIKNKTFGFHGYFIKSKEQYETM
jgi:hypothetical protein